MYLSSKAHMYMKANYFLVFNFDKAASIALKGTYLVFMIEYLLMDDKLT